MSNSALATQTILSPFFSRRTMPIDTITPHCMAAKKVSAAACGKLFQQKVKGASSNYGIGYEGEVALYVEEDKASWCSSKGANDNRAITIEIANSDGAPDWPISQASWNSLVNLCADICKRNGKKRMKWVSDRAKALKYAAATDEMNMTLHRWFAAKSCPGNWLADRMPVLAAEVNRKLESMEDEEMTGEEIYRRLSEYLNSLPTSDYAEEASRKGIESGLFMDGDNDGLVDNPKAPVTRQDLAVVLMRGGLLHHPEDPEDG